jgi:4-hydroxy-tetrahydrodipicolinate synthase
MINLKGIMTALTTPLKANGTVDEQQMLDLIEFQIRRGVHSLLVLGGTGEYTSLTTEERRKIVDISVKAVNRRVPVIIGVLETGLGECLAFGRYCKSAGADALLVLTPFYYVGTQDSLVDFYVTLDRQVDMPILLYNIPYRTNVNLLPDTVLRLTREMRNLAGIKECAPLGQAMELLLKTGDKIHVLTGDEFAAVSLMSMGMKGAVMATANVVPEAWVRMYDLVQEGKIGEAMDMSLRYFTLFKILFSENYIGPLKYAMERVGAPGGAVVLPLAGPRPDTKEKLEAEMKKLSLI